MKFNDLDIINSNLNNRILNNLTKTIKENKFIFSKEVNKLEKKLKEHIDQGLSVWLEPIGDKSKLRKLRGVEVKSKDI